MTLDTHVKNALTDLTNAAKATLDRAEEDVKWEEAQLAQARLLRDSAQEKYNALQRFLNDNS